MSVLLLFMSAIGPVFASNPLKPLIVNAPLEAELIGAFERSVMVMRFNAEGAAVL